MEKYNSKELKEMQDFIDKIKKIKKLQTGIVLNHVNKNGVTKISINENKKYEN